MRWVLPVTGLGCASYRRRRNSSAVAGKIVAFGLSEERRIDGSAFVAVSANVRSIFISGRQPVQIESNSPAFAPARKAFHSL
jgi:hypothetical protein